ncbi:hypothetical protein CMUS01_08193 [Colletotrichum musicola]|uniref:Uncharacterized protein n=1 Tax=Colletotrichum musicola TaxID=2175873 RepID=A0A8H6KDL1_9PEZI|nr:hypothetical protein CMUS01_08193 [Colletotrichum musicola]
MKPEPPERDGDLSMPAVDDLHSRVTPADFPQDGTQGWASDADGIERMDSLWDIESLDTASGEETGKVFLAQSQSETTGKAADLTRLAESTKHDTFDVVRGFASLRTVDVDVGMGRALEFSWWCGGVGGSGGHHGNNNLFVNAPSALPAALFFSPIRNAMADSRMNPLNPIVSPLSCGDH